MQGLRDPNCRRRETSPTGFRAQGLSCNLPSAKVSGKSRAQPVKPLWHNSISLHPQPVHFRRRPSVQGVVVEGLGFRGYPKPSTLNLTQNQTGTEVERLAKARLRLSKSGGELVKVSGYGLWCLVASTLFNLSFQYPESPIPLK